MTECCYCEVRGEGRALWELPSGRRVLVCLDCERQLEASVPATPYADLRRRMAERRLERELEDEAVEASSWAEAGHW